MRIDSHDIVVWWNKIDKPIAIIVLQMVVLQEIIDHTVCNQQTQVKQASVNNRKQDIWQQKFLEMTPSAVSNNTTRVTRWYRFVASLPYYLRSLCYSCHMLFAWEYPVRFHKTQYWVSSRLPLQILPCQWTFIIYAAASRTFQPPSRLHTVNRKSIFAGHYHFIAKTVLCANFSVRVVLDSSSTYKQFIYALGPFS